MAQTKSIMKNKKISGVFFQKLLVFGLFFSIIGLFIYSLVFMTPFFDLYKLCYGGATFSVKTLQTVYNVDYTRFDSNGYIYKLDDFTDEPTTEVKSLNMEYYGRYINDLQAINKTIFIISLISIVVSLILFIYRSQLRKKYYITNLVANSVVGIYTITISGILFSKMLACFNKLDTIEYELFNIYKSYNDIHPQSDDDTVKEFFSKAGFSVIYYIGFALLAILIIFSVCLIAYSVVNYISSKKNEVDISGVVVNE